MRYVRESDRSISIKMYSKLYEITLSHRLSVKMFLFASLFATNSIVYLIQFPSTIDKKSKSVLFVVIYTINRSTVIKKKKYLQQKYYIRNFNCVILLCVFFFHFSSSLFNLFDITRSYQAVNVLNDSCQQRNRDK